MCMVFPNRKLHVDKGILCTLAILSPLSLFKVKCG